MNSIDVTIPVAEVLDQHPELLDLLVELGFKPLANPLMRQTAGRKVSLQQGAALVGLDLTEIKRVLVCNGYDVLGDET